jgi:uncharacterized protein YjiS (DUF1127 family)
MHNAHIRRAVGFCRGYKKDIAMFVSMFKGTNHNKRRHNPPGVSIMALEQMRESAAWSGWRSWSTELATSLAKLALFWQDRWRQRQALAEMDDRMLRDVGLTRANVDTEASKPFWRY